MMVETFFTLISAGLVVLISLLLVYWLVAPIFTTPFFVSRTAEMLAMFSMAAIGRTDNFVDLGSGDGRVALAASRLSASATGIELNPFLNIWARFVALISPNGQLSYRTANYWYTNLSDFDVVYIYQFPRELKRLQRKLEAELHPGARVVTHSFRIPGWEAEAQRKIAGKTHYLYVVPKHAAR